jgi:hypothetical protein
LYHNTGVLLPKSNYKNYKKKCFIQAVIKKEITVQKLMANAQVFCASLIEGAVVLE